MTTRLKRPSLLRQFLVGALLVSFQAYLGYSAINGQFGITSRQQMLLDIKALQAEKTMLQAKIDNYQQHIALFDPKQLDPDIISEKGRALLSMANPDDIIIPLAK